MTKKHIPALRFDGFSNPWVLRHLAEFEITTGPFGSTLHAEDYVEHGTPIVTTEHFKSGMLPLTGQGVPQVSDDDRCRLKVYWLQTDDIVFSRVGSVDINARVTELQNGWLFSGRVLRLRPDTTCDAEFLHSVLETDPVRGAIRKRAVGMSMPSINTAILANTSFYQPPTLEEQRAIGELFADLDTLIEQHRTKHANLQQTKTALLQRMFPQDEADEPELRLNGFSAAWDEVRIQNVSDVLVGNPFQSSSFVDDGIRLVRGMNVKRGWLDFDQSLTVFWPSIRGVETFLLDQNDILLQMDGALIGKSFAMVSKTDLPALLVQRVARVRAHHNVDPKFLYQWFAKDFFGYIRSVKTETAVPHLSALDILSFRVKIPPSLEEQRAIGEVFADLDALIAAESRYITQLTQAKTALLQRMFV
ncbi:MULTISPECIES: restriction endonuclease subunit S [Corynebacterium]|uniref:Restriction endonuclease subunit S n=1 Tax=Corynebacterium pseudogenitalium TaxID=38303 RepID=A0ABD4TQH2_9CORY|nr:restriction endonuclease subunit S [Corynebacterium sp. MC3]MCQ4614557.1 restriction endonuclease subunit S [Corynebacterium pseudogenitalium]